MIQALRLTVACLFFGIVTSKNEYFGLGGLDYTDECMDELGLKFLYENRSPEIDRNRTCITKCTYDKEGKIDSEGNLDISRFPKEQQEAVEKCWKLIQIDDLCEKVNKLTSCIYRETEDYYRKYDVCDEFHSYTEESESSCYTRCQLIVDERLLKDGSVNLSKLTTYGDNQDNKITPKQALEICSVIIKDEDKCARDVNMNNCAAYVTSHYSEQKLRDEMRCAKETNTYPFISTTPTKSRVCYDRCVMQLSGEWNSENPMKSQVFADSGMNQAKIEKAFSNCKKALPETDHCTKDLYFYDCVNYHNYVDDEVLKNQIECALETKSPLQPLRYQYAENHCMTRCLLIKSGNLDENGEINRTELESYTIDSTIVDVALEYCNSRKKGDSCADDVNAYYCAFNKIEDLKIKLCYDNNFNSNYICAARCLMIQSRELDSNGDILIDNIMTTTNQSIEVVEKAIRICKSKENEQHYCNKDVELYHCVSLEIYNIVTLDENNTDS